MNRGVSESKISAFGTDDIFVLLAICRKMRTFLNGVPDEFYIRVGEEVQRNALRVSYPTSPHLEKTYGT